jgi:HPt (histidine-containing phosphotransfer) domain-containing protein
MTELERVLNVALQACGNDTPETAAEQPVPAAPVDGLLDEARCAEIKELMRESGPDVFGGMVRRLKKDLNAFDAALPGWVTQHDGDSMARAAHSLKGASHSIGAQRLGNLFADVEKLAKARQLDDAARQYARHKGVGGASITVLDQADRAA